MYVYYDIYILCVYNLGMVFVSRLLLYVVRIYHNAINESISLSFLLHMYLHLHYVHNICMLHADNYIIMYSDNVESTSFLSSQMT